jgi:hypothetical protein
MRSKRKKYKIGDVDWSIRVLWDARSIPEFSALPLKERCSIGFPAFFRAWRHYETWTAFLFCVLCLVVGGWIWFEVFPKSFFAGLVYFLFAAAGSVVFRLELQRMARPYILEELAKRKKAGGEKLLGKVPKA